jgi:hypothetical protein
MIAICTAATRSYLHAWPQLIRAIATAASHHKEAHFIFSTDQSEEGKSAEEFAKGHLPEGWKITTLRLPIEEDAKDYKEEAQIRIARLQGAAFEFSRRIKATSCWSVESDTIPTPDSLRVLEWTLQMPDACGDPYYHIAAATYPNGLFLGGFGDHRNQIAEDFLPSERKLKPRLKLLLEETEKLLKETKDRSVAEKEMKRMGRLREWVKKSPPDGNIWEVTAKHGWRRRGWMDYAYPGIGLGAVVPSDWCGLGCTLLSQKALQLCDFNSYTGVGTQDLFLCWARWKPAGLRIACVPHVVCDHIKRQGDKIVHHKAWHEQDPAYFGHLRQRQQAFVPL